MLANVPGEVLMFFLIATLVLAVVVVVGGAIWGISKAVKNNSPTRTRVIIVSVVAILIAAASWILNMGWIRFIMTLVSIPFVHAIIFFLTNFFMAPYADASKSVKRLNLLFCVTYLLFYVFLPDGGDYGGLYFFFGLIHNDLLSYIAEGISSIALAGHIALFVLQLVFAGKIRKSQSDNSGTKPGQNHI